MPGVQNGGLGSYFSFQNSICGQSAEKLAVLRQIYLYIQAISPMRECSFIVHCYGLRSQSRVWSTSTVSSTPCRWRDRGAHPHRLMLLRCQHDVVERHRVKMMIPTYSRHTLFCSYPGGRKGRTSASSDGENNKLYCPHSTL